MPPTVYPFEHSHSCDTHELQMSGLPDSVRMICINKECLNKSIVYRKLNQNKIQVCKKCGSELERVKDYVR